MASRGRRAAPGFSGPSLTAARGSLTEWERVAPLPFVGSFGNRPPGGYPCQLQRISPEVRRPPEIALSIVPEGDRQRLLCQLPLRVSEVAGLKCSYRSTAAGAFKPALYHSTHRYPRDEYASGGRQVSSKT